MFIGLKPSQTVLLFTTPSSTGKGEHQVKLGKDGNVYCSCGAWKFQKGVHPHDRTCKHIKAAQAAGLIPTPSKGS